MKEYSDYELVSYVSENNEEANQILFEKYKPLIVATAKKFHKYCHHNGIEINDLIQEGYLGFNLAINNFNEQKDTTFYTYSTKCIERKMISLIIASSRQKHKFLNESVSFELYNDEEQYTELQNLLSDNSYNPENIFLDNENQMNLISKIKDKLTEFEQQVFELKISNFNYKEIAELLEKEPKAIDNAIQRIRAKAKNTIQNK